MREEKNERMWWRRKRTRKMTNMICEEVQEEN
jgi:hypothetical protein